MILAKTKYVCVGTIGTKGLPGQIAMIFGLAYTVIQVIVPVLLIVWGSLDFAKAVIGQKEDEIKKGQQTFMKRLVAAAIMFFVSTITYFLIDILAVDDTKGTISSCAQEILACKSATCKNK